MEKPPRWLDDPPTGFRPDGTSLMYPYRPGEPLKTFEPKIIGPDGKLMTVKEYEASKADDDVDDDLSDLDDIAAIAK